MQLASGRGGRKNLNEAGRYVYMVNLRTVLGKRGLRPYTSERWLEIMGTSSHHTLQTTVRVCLAFALFLPAPTSDSDATTMSPSPGGRFVGLRLQSRHVCVQEENEAAGIYLN